MIIKNSKLIIGVLIILIFITLIGCSNKPKDTNMDNLNDSPPNDNTSDKPANDFIVGYYEGTTDQSGQNVLTSLNLKEGSTYELYISTTGLVDRGIYKVLDKENIKFTSEMTSGELKGSYNNGRIISHFSIGSTESELTFDQVGSPDDFYKYFLGDYIAAASNNDIFVLSLRENKLFEISSTDLKGTFEIIDGKIILTKDNNEKLSTGDFFAEEKSVKITLPINNAESEYLFTQNSEENNITYYGFSTKGMSGNTPVNLIIKPAKRFELVTSKPRGIGTYEIGEKTDGGYKLVLTYTDPAARPDGSIFTMNGIISSENINDVSAVITVEQVEYQVDMGSGNLSTMNLGRVEFSTTLPKESSSETSGAPAQDNPPDDTASTDNTAPADDTKPADNTNAEEDKKPESPQEETKDNTLNVVGSYTTTVMGTTEVIMELKDDGSYELGTGESGTYTVSKDGKITFTPATEGRPSYETCFDSEGTSFTVKFSIINGTSESNYVFTKK